LNEAIVYIMLYVKSLVIISFSTISKDSFTNPYNKKGNNSDDPEFHRNSSWNRKMAPYSPDFIGVYFIDFPVY